MSVYSIKKDCIRIPYSDSARIGPGKIIPYPKPTSPKSFFFGGGEGGNLDPDSIHNAGVNDLVGNAVQFNNQIQLNTGYLPSLV
jgi:hypothetical protein